MSKRILILLFVLPISLLAAAIPHSTRIFHPDVRTLRTRYIDVSTGEPEWGDPVRCFLAMDKGAISTHGDRAGHVLEFSFDWMNHDSHSLSYTIRHLDRYYEEDNLISSDYLRGFTSADITDYATSFNTAQDYTHYRFTFPNEDMALTASGNYVAVIYEDYNPDRIIATVTFEVVEPEVIVDGHIRTATDIEINRRYQQLDIDIKNLRGATPSNDYTVFARQNGRTDNAACEPKPTYIENGAMRWTQSRPLIFEGGNCHRHLDIFSTYIAGTGVERIVYDRGEYHALLQADAPRANEAYMHEYDARGQFIINAERTENDETEAEYMWVHFQLYTAPVEGEVYVAGEWNQNRYDYRNRMLYDGEHGCYYLTVLMKQGGYDYQYLTTSKHTARGEREQAGCSTFAIEGSHWQTPNEYTIYVYYHPIGAQYDRLVGLQRL